MDLTTVSRVRDLWEFDETLLTTATLTNFLTIAVSDWSARAVKLLNREPATATYTEYLDVDRGQRVFSLRAFPVSSIVSVTSDLSREFTGATISESLYSCQTSTGMLRLDYHEPAGRGTLEVVYAGGMAPTAASFAAAYPDIAGAIDMQVAYVFERKTSFGKTAVSVGGAGNVGYLSPMDWLPSVKAAILAHRRVYLG